MYEFLGIDIKTLNDCRFKFYQTGLIQKILESIGMEHCKMLKTPTKVEAPLGIYEDSSEAKRARS